VESEDKNCAKYIWSIWNNKERIRSEPSVAPRPGVKESVAELYGDCHVAER
jgi:hypothetical protein